MGLVLAAFLVCGSSTWFLLVGGLADRSLDRPWLN